MQEINLNVAASQAQATQRPLVVGLMRSNCPFCKALKQQHLNSMVSAQRITYVDLDLDSARRVRVNDESLSIHAFAERSGASTDRPGKVLTPTILFFNKQLQQIAEPLVGYSPDFYGYYLEERLVLCKKLIGS